jgi:hypothetical protein
MSDSWVQHFQRRLCLSDSGSYYSGRWRGKQAFNSGCYVFIYMTLETNDRLYNTCMWIITAYGLMLIGLYWKVDRKLEMMSLKLMTQNCIISSVEKDRTQNQFNWMIHWNAVSLMGSGPDFSPWVRYSDIYHHRMAQLPTLSIRLARIHNQWSRVAWVDNNKFYLQHEDEDDAD